MINVGNSVIVVGLNDYGGLAAYPGRWMAKLGVDIIPGIGCDVPGALTQLKGKTAVRGDARVTVGEPAMQYGDGPGIYIVFLPQLPSLNLQSLDATV